jgi:O-acetyl-ADP-ribose deacetylase (regulator of RNase III)
MGNGPARPANYGERKPTLECGEWTAPTGQKIQIRLGDITQEDTDAIVNAANSRLAHGSGVAGAISKRGGPMIQDESDNIIKKRKEIPTGQAVVTKGYWLWAPYVIHAVGPIWSGGKKKEPEQLIQTVVTSLEIAEKRKLKSIAIPAISSGIFGFPKPLCAQLMFETTMKFFEEHPKGRLQLVRFTNFDKSTVIIFQKEYEKRFGPLPEELKVKEDPKTKKKKPTTNKRGSDDGAGDRHAASSDDDDDDDDDGDSNASDNHSHHPEHDDDEEGEKGSAKKADPKGKGKMTKVKNDEEEPEDEDEDKNKGKGKGKAQDEGKNKNKDDKDKDKSKDKNKDDKGKAQDEGKNKNKGKDEDDDDSSEKDDDDDGDDDDDKKEDSGKKAKNEKNSGKQQPASGKDKKKADSDSSHDDEGDD